MAEGGEDCGGDHFKAADPKYFGALKFSLKISFDTDLSHSPLLSDLVNKK